MFTLVELTTGIEDAFNDYLSDWKESGEEIIPSTSAKGKSTL
ncbi:hypothetical protein [Sporolactobacillus nakayamae]|nr:hypothetical protein [Sporolactobacillus nakayamae]